jgi:DNA-binding SARP family transcriptional activator/class 3 adenylate cyclase
VSVLFTDAVASTELFTALGDEAADALRRDHIDGLRAIVEARGGHVVKGLGDGIMAVFDGAAAAVEAGVAIQQHTTAVATNQIAALQVRVGVSAGDASTEGDDWFGTPVVEASRLCASAAPQQVLVSDLVRRLAGSRTSVAFRELGTRALKGLPEPVLVHEVHAGDAATAGRRGRRKAAATRPSRFALIGRFAVECEGEPLRDADLGNRKARLLLKLLAVRHGRHVGMDAIIDALWGDGAPAKAAENVATLVSRLRTTLGSDVIEGGRSGYRLVVPAGCTVDTDDARRLVEEAETRLDAGQPALAATAAGHALELLGAAVPLEEETAEGDWLDELRRDLERLVRRGRVAGWRASAGIGEHREALAIAEQAVAADPLDEEAHRAVIAAYHRLGEPGEALAAYERLRTTLVDELGADPGPESESLYLSVLRGEPVPDEIAPGGTAAAHDPIVGRDRERADLLREWERASRGAPSCVLVVGEAGIGKTRLVADLVGAVRAIGGSVAEARCYESEESLFLQPVVDALRQLAGTLPPDLVRDATGAWGSALGDIVPDLARLVDDAPYERGSPEMERRRTFEAIASFLAAVSRRRPLLVVLDDLHNAGASTLEIVHFVLRWDPSARILIAATVQSDRRAHVEAQLGSRATTINIGPLSEAAVAQLADDAGRPDLTSELRRLTNGHTLFVLEALRAVAGTDGEVLIPESLRAAVTTRVARCGADVEEFLRGAVVAGAVFEVEHVAELLGLGGEEAVRRAETALRAGLLAEAGTGYQFANDVIRKVLYDTTPAPTRLVRHRRLAALLAGQPEAAAEHSAAAGDWEDAVDHWLDAAARSLAAFANGEADGLLTRAFDACGLLGDPLRTARVQLQRGRARLAQARYDEAARDLAAVQALARAMNQSELEATAIETLGWCALYGRRIERAGELAERAIRHPAAGAGAQVLAGRLRNVRGDLAGAVETLRPVVDEAADPAVRASALSYLGTALAHSDRFAEAIGVLDEAVLACQAVGTIRPMFNAMFFVAITRANLGDLAGALEAAMRMEDAVERYENDAYRPRGRNLLSWLWRELGDDAYALDLAQQALETARLPDGYLEVEPAAHARLQLAETALRIGDDSEAAHQLDDLAATVLSDVAFGWRVELHRLELAARLDSVHADELLTRAQEHGSLKYEALALAHLGRNEDAAAAAATTGSDLLVAHVAPDPTATAAANRVATNLRAEHRARFLDRGAWRSSDSRRRR